MEGLRFQQWSAWPRYRSLQGFGKSGFSGDSKLQNSAAVLAAMISMGAIKMILMAGGPLKPGFSLSGDVQIFSRDFSFLSDRLTLGSH